MWTHITRAALLLTMFTALAVPSPAAAQCLRETLIPSGTEEDDRVGNGVASDGDWLVVGAPGLGDGGSILIYRKDPIGTWGLVQTLRAADTDVGDRFGEAVAIDGDRIAVGAPGVTDYAAERGLIYIFEWNGFAWFEAQTLNVATGTDPVRSGQSLDISGDWLVSGDPDYDYESGRATVFRWNGVSWEFDDHISSPITGAYRERFGQSVGVGVDSVGNPYVLVGMWDRGNGSIAGEVHVYERISGEFVEVETLTAADGHPDDRFGRRIDVFHPFAVIGAFESDAGAGVGAAYVVRRLNDGSWEQVAQLLPFDLREQIAGFGWSVAADPSRIVVGAPISVDPGLPGQAFSFLRTGTTIWEPEHRMLNPTPAAGDGFGSSVVVNGTDAFVGAVLASDGGTVTRYELGCADCDGNGLDDATETDTDNDGVIDACDVCEGASDFFDTDGDGAPDACDLCEGFPDVADFDQDGAPDGCDADSCSGQLVVPADAEAFDQVGAAVALDGETLLVGRPRDTVATDYSGSAVVFSLDDAGTSEPADDRWVEQAALTVDTIGAEARLGETVALSGDLAVVGAPGAGSFAGAAYLFERSGSTWSTAIELLPPTGPISFDTLGSAVAVDGTIVAVGARGANVGSGIVHVFDGSAWVASLFASDGDADDQFGGAVAVGANGDWILVGAPGADGADLDHGAIYAFRRTGPSSWVEHARLEPEDAERFWESGAALALDASADTLVVGAPGGAQGVVPSGSAYVYARADMGTPTELADDLWFEETRLTMLLPGFNERFGSAVEIADGQIAVGSPYWRASGDYWLGRVRLFDLVGGLWSQTGWIDSPVVGDDAGYGYAVGLSSDWIAVGAPFADLAGAGSGLVETIPMLARWDGDGDGIVDSCDVCPLGSDAFDGDGDGIPDACDICLAGPDAFDGDGDGVPDGCDACPGFDDSVDEDADAIPDDCDPCPAGANSVDTDADTVPDACDVCPGEDDTIDLDGNGIPDACEVSALAELLASDAEADDFFGTEVAIDGTVAVVGAPEGKLFDVATGKSGSAYVYTFDGGSWVERQTLLPSDPSTDMLFGQSVDVDGGLLAVGAPLAPSSTSPSVLLGGAVYLFRWDGTSWIEEAKLTASDDAEGDLFGRSVSVDGDRVAVGAAFADSATGDITDGPGAVYVFRNDAGSWIEEQKLTASDAAAGALLGQSVDLNGGRLAAGALRAGAGDPGPGAAYVFDLFGTMWGETVRLGDVAGDPGDLFGNDVVVLDDGTVLVAAPLAGSTTEPRGAVFVFEESDGVWAETQKFVSPDGTSAARFAGALSAEGERMVATDRELDASYLIRRNAVGVWEFESRLTASDTAADDLFGEAAAVAGDLILVSAPAHVHAGSAGGGAVYVHVAPGAEDCNDNGVPDIFETVDSVYDCDGDRVLDVCADSPPADTDGDGIADGCDVAPGADDDPDGDGVSGPIVVDPAWALTRVITFDVPVGAHINPVDGLVYTGRRTGDRGLYRIETDGSATPLWFGDDIAAVAIDPDDGDVFVTDDYSGEIFRTAFGAIGRQVWTSGFHSGDDDPVGMAMVPATYSGSVVAPGQAVVVDRGANGLDEIWAWSPDTSQGESVIHADDGTLVDATDVTVSDDSIWVADTGASGTGVIYEVGAGGALSPLVTSEPLGGPAAIHWDRASGDLFVLEGSSNVGGRRVVRVDPTTGTVSEIVIELLGSVAWAGLDLSADGRRMVVTDRGSNRIFEFTLACPGEGDADFDGVCDSADLCPGGDDARDGDGDGVPNGCDDCPGAPDGVDSDGDGVADGCDACPGWVDTADGDGDGTPDGCEANACQLDMLTPWLVEIGDDRFGVNDVYGDWIVVGAIRDDEVCTACGAVYLFRRVGSQWVEHQKLVPSGPSANQAGMEFGRSVAIHGDWIAVGARGVEEFGTSLDDGAVFLFRLDDLGTPEPSDDLWRPAGSLQPDPVLDEGSFFGTRIDVGPRWLAVGAVGNDFVDKGGVVYVYEQEGGVWGSPTRLTAPDPNAVDPVDRFGADVALQDGLLVVGAYGHTHPGVVSLGAVYVYRHDGAGWSFEAELLADASPEVTAIGTRIDTDGQRIVVGALFSDTDDNAADLYRHDGEGIWTFEDRVIVGQSVRSRSFADVAIDGRLALIGDDEAFDEEIAGADRLHVLRNDGSRWRTHQELRPEQPDPDTFYDHDFPSWITLDGGLAVAGSLLWDANGAAFVFGVGGDCNGNGVSDVCEVVDGALPDADGDLVPDGCDLCPGGNDREDFDRDGTPDGCDPCPLDAPDDTDGDGICDSDDPCDETLDPADDDSDGFVNACDLCPGRADDPDGDGVAGPCLVESGWTLTRSIAFESPMGAHYNPIDDRIYVGRRSGAKGLYRIEPDGSASPLWTGDDVAAVLVDPVDGDVFATDDFSGEIWRTPLESTGRFTWTTGFHSGDDDPVGMAIAPAGYAGAELTPGEAVVVDRGANGPDELWRWSTESADGETPIHSDDGTLVDPVDVTVSSTAIWIADGAGAEPGAIYRVEAGGALTALATSEPLGNPVGLQADPAGSDLIVLDTRSGGGAGRVVRVDTLTGQVLEMIRGVDRDSRGGWAGLDMTPDGVRIFVTDRSADRIYQFSRTCAGEPNADGDGICDAGDRCPGFDDAIDSDDDGAPDGCDLCPADGLSWAAPTPVTDLVVGGTAEATLLTWSLPFEPGTIGDLVYDVVATASPEEVTATAECVESRGSDTEAVDAVVPPPGVLRSFVVRATNSCAPGSFGETTEGAQRSGSTCP